MTSGAPRTPSSKRSSPRGGIPDYYDLLDERPGGPQTEFQRVWTPTEILAALPTERTPPGSTFAYTETNYLLLSLVIERLRGRPLTDVLRDGALAMDGLERLVYQPDEHPTEPIAMPGGASPDVLRMRGGYIPSLASATAYHASGAIASDSPSLARWWRALCAGEIVSQASLTEMSTFRPAAYLGSYGLGMYNPADGYAQTFGHTGELPTLACSLVEVSVHRLRSRRRLLEASTSPYGFKSPRGIHSW